MAKQTQSQEQEPNKPTQSYISRVRLKGYKSIIDTEVTFKPGLNIIIGANGSGKTNFVEFLKKILHGDFDEISEKYEVLITALVNQKDLEYSLDYKLSNLKNSNDFVPNFKEKLTFNNILTDNPEYSASVHFPTITFNVEWRELNSSYISYGVPKEFQEINNLIKLEYKIINENENDNIVYFRKPSFTIGLQELLDKIFVDNIFNGDLFLSKKIDLIPFEFKNNLNRFTPIKNIKISENFNAQNFQNNWVIDYIRFEFLLESRWLTWNQLSDGTKRIFYIITEVTFANNVILLEEPELGIHPHQLSKLMDFLKEQSEEKQIILTTHSPQVLNILSTDELDRIIVAHYDKENGTQLHHLTEEEMSHARSYMETEGLFLSDYWVYSGFEKEEEQV